MRLISQKQKILVRNINDENEKNLPPRYSALLPNTIRALIVGPSNCGKTNIMLSLIESPDGLKLENVIYFQIVYTNLNMSTWRNSSNRLKEWDIIHFSIMTVLDPSEAKTNSIMIFEDVACEKHDNIRSYFCMGRNKNKDPFFYVKHTVIDRNI